MRICYAKIHEIVCTQCSLRRARYLPFRELKPLLRVSEIQARWRMCWPNDSLVHLLGIERSKCTSHGQLT